MNKDIKNQSGSYDGNSLLYQNLGINFIRSDYYANLADD